MIYLILAACIWAFSFGLIKSSLTNIDPALLTTIRLFLSMIVFLPFLRIKQINLSNAISLLIIGMIQYGAMYVLYLYGFRYLKGYEVALLTLTTPLWVALFGAVFDYKRLLLVLISIIGAGVVVYKGENPSWSDGLILIQLSNMAFALGQVLYIKIKNGIGQTPDHSIFALLYIGGFICSACYFTFNGDLGDIFDITLGQIPYIIYLGVIASGLALFLWNKGAAITSITSVAILNNLKIPLAVFASLFIFGEEVNIISASIGFFILIATTIIAQKFSKI